MPGYVLVYDGPNEENSITATTDEQYDDRAALQRKHLQRDGGHVRSSSFLL